MRRKGDHYGNRSDRHSGNYSNTFIVANNFTDRFGCSRHRHFSRYFFIVACWRDLTPAFTVVFPVLTFLVPAFAVHSHHLIYTVTDG